jgi:transcriptional regulator with XRE-family HTH domain
MADKKITLRKLTELTDLNQRRLENYVQRRKEPSVPAALKISAALNISVSDVDWSRKEKASESGNTADAT